MIKYQPALTQNFLVLIKKMCQLIEPVVIILLKFKFFPAVVTKNCVASINPNFR